jgi:histidinol-phosphatase (PHP family)
MGIHPDQPRNAIPPDRREPDRSRIADEEGPAAFWSGAQAVNPLGAIFGPMAASSGFGNYHTHTHHCDGKGAPWEFAEAAIRKGMPRLGFSGHNVVPFSTSWTMPAERLESYVEDVTSAREKYRGRLEVFLGIEADFIPGVASPAHPRIRDLRLDFVIGSVHFVGPRDGDHEWTVDGPKQELAAMLQDGFGGDRRRLVERYYDLLSSMSRDAAPDIIGHFDLIKKNNRDGSLFSEQAPWYGAAVRTALEAVRKAGAILEVNTGGMTRNTSGAFYPSAWILEEARRMGIPVVISADAHTPDHVDGMFAEAVEFVKKAGYRLQRQLTVDGWIDVPL